MGEPEAEPLWGWDAPVARRGLIRGGLAGVLLLGVGGLLPGACRSYPKPRVPLRFFNANEYAIVNTLAGRLLDAVERIGPATTQVDVAANVDPLVLRWEPEAQTQLRTMLRVFEHGTYLFDLRGKRFTRLSEEQQDGYIEGWMRSTLGARRVVFRALKALVAAGFYQDARTWQQLGYDGPWLGRVYVVPPAEPEQMVALTALRTRDK